MNRSLPNDGLYDGLTVLDNDIEVDAPTSVFLEQFIGGILELFGQCVDRNGTFFVSLNACFAQFGRQLLDAIAVECA